MRDQTSAYLPRSDYRAAFLALRLRRAAFRLERISFEPCGECALQKSPRYFSASMSLRLLTARRNQVGEYVGVLSVVEATTKFVHVQRQVFLADLVVAPHNASFEQAPKAFDCVGMSRADDVFLPAVANDVMIHVLAQQPITGMFVGRDQLDRARFGDGLADEAILMSRCRCSG